MAYDERVADLVRQGLSGEPGVTEKKMFGGVAFMVNGHMCCGVVKDELVFRLGNDLSAGAVTRPHARYCDFTGKVMKTMVMVSPEGFKGKKALKEWLDMALGYARTLPPKK